MSGTEGRRLDGKVAIVTCGAAGLGLAYARRFRRRAPASSSPTSSRALERR